MSQSTDTTLSNQSGASFRIELNAILDAIVSSHKGSSQPSYRQAGMFWLDDASTPWILKFYDGTSWLTVMELNATTNLVRLAEQADAASLTGVPTVKQIQNNSLTYATTTGSSNAYSVDYGSGLRPTALAAGQEFNLKLNHANTGAATLEVTLASGSGSGPKNIVLPDGSSPAPSELALNGQIKVRYDGTSMVIVGGIGSGGGAFGSQTSLASAGTTELGSVPSRNVLITGTTAITAFGNTANTARPVYLVQFAGALTLTHNATSLILPGGANITTAAGDSAMVEYLGSGNWRVRTYMRASGVPLVINNNSIALNKLVVGTADRLFGTDDSGNPVEVTAGSGIVIDNGQIAASIPPPYTTIHDGAVTPGTTLNFNWTNNLYDRIEIDIRDIYTSSNSTEAGLRLFNNGGVISSGYIYNSILSNNTGTPTTSSSNYAGLGSTAIPLGTLNTATGNYGGSITLRNLKGGKPTFTVNFTEMASGEVVQHSGLYDTPLSQVSGIRIFSDRTLNGSVRILGYE